MINRRYIEQLLKLNGLKPDSPDDEIKSVLVSARWHENDVETALVVLRENSGNQEQHIDTFHKTFNSDTQFSPDTLNAILGIDIEIESITSSRKDELKRTYKMQLVSIAALSIGIAMFFLFFVMWYMKVGVFYASS
ncbi:MAG: hypothetical protein ACI9VM_000876 [Candidatus Azotimanducaceae bacterium]|jgi:hypothetical protein